MAGPTIKLVTADPRQSAELARLHRNLGKVYATIPVYELAEITHVQPDGLGRPAWALTEKGYKIDLSLGTPIREGEQWMLRGEGGPAGRRWLALFRVNTHGDLLGPMPGRYIPPPVIPASTYGGWESAEDGSAVDDATGASGANALVYFRSIAISGNYDVYEMHLPAIHWRARELGADDWGTINSELLFQPARCFLTLNAPVSTSALAWSVTPDPDTAADIPQGKLLFWYVEGEVVVGTLTGSVLAIDSRGADATDALAHGAGARILLASGRLAITGLRQALEYEIQLAFGGAFNEVGMWSDTIDVTTWERLDPPAPPTNVRVDLNNDEYQIRWTPPADATVKQFRLLRWPMGVGDPNPAALYRVDEWLAVGATDLGLTAGTAAIVPVHGLTSGAGPNFGVASHANGGLESQVAWNNDTWIPVSPNHTTVTVTPVPSGILVKVGDTSAFNRSGFRRYILWQATSSSATVGAGATRLYTFGERTSEQTFPIPQSGTVYLYQVTSENWAGAFSVPVPGAAWKYAPSLLPSDTYPHNGNFQVPNNAGALPQNWSFHFWRHRPDGVMVFDDPNQQMLYDEDGGLTGNYCIHLKSLGGYQQGSLIWEFDSDILVPFNMRKTMVVTMYFKYVYLNPSVANLMSLTIIPYIRLYADQAGTSRDVGISHDDPRFWTNGTGWIKPNNTPSQPLGIWQSAGAMMVLNDKQSDRTSFARFGVQIATADTNGGMWYPFDVYLDDIIAVSAVPATPSGLVITDATISIT